MRKLVLLVCILLFVFCAPRKTAIETEGLEEVVVFGEEEQAPVVVEEPVLPAEEEPVPPPPVVEPVAEPMPQAEEEIVLIPPPVETEPMVTEPPIVEPYVPPEPETPAMAPQKVYGFRVQIFASSTEENASRIASDAREMFTDRVYVEYVSPYYKVRVGDYLTREEVEPLKNKALSLGYRGAFVVETMVSP